MLTKAQIEEYNEVGVILLPDILTGEEVARLREVTDRFVERSRSATTHTDIFDLEDGHSSETPRLRRIKFADLHDPTYAAMARHPRILAALCDLWGPDVRFQTAKLNLKSAEYGSAVEWHQDWAFYPHTNDDLAAVGVMIDDMDMDNGPMLVVPGSHKAPVVFDHHFDGKFCGAMDPTRRDVDFDSAIPLTGKAGTISIHHVRAVHGSAINTSSKNRRLLLYQYAAADAWPLLYAPLDIAAFDRLIVAGRPTLEPRLTSVPVRLPLPPPEKMGSIYENQRVLPNRYFDRPQQLR